MKKYTVLFLLLLSFSFAYGQKVIFLHHSTGEGVYVQGNVVQWFSTYNTQHGTNYQVSERNYPDTPYPWQNYPYDYWYLWINNQCNNTNPNIECMDKITQNYDVIIFKHCFPGASIVADNGTPLVSSPIQTLANYKLQYRALRAMMDSYPSRKFIVWTLTPLHRLATTTEEAARARQFVDWVKTSWLTEDAKAHPNIYIFDFFGYMAESNAAPANGKLNCLKYDYEGSHTTSDSHPNLLANQTIGPIFSQFIVNAINNVSTGINTLSSDQPVRIYPNPSTGEITVDLSGIDNSNASIEIFDLQGKLALYKSCKNQVLVHISTRTLNNGLYIVRTKTGSDILHNKLYVAQ